MNKLIIISLIILVIYLLYLYFRFNKKSSFNFEVYSNQNQSCDLDISTRIYPSGNVPGSYLGLTPQERETLLIKFIDYKGEIN
jgi:hypothetical protein